MSRKLTLCISILLLFSYALVFGDTQEPAVKNLSFENSGLPGFTAGVLYLFNSQRIYTGGTVRFDFFYTVDEDRKNSTFVDRGRSEIYIAVGMYAATPQRSDGVNLVFNYVFGFNLSFETPGIMQRNFLIPYIGLEIGGMYIQTIGNAFIVCPIIGINLVSLPTVTLSIETGLLLSTVDFDEFLSLRPQLALNFVL
jgi:hypothetical protein